MAFAFWHWITNLIFHRLPITRQAFWAQHAKILVRGPLPFDQSASFTRHILSGLFFQ